MATLTYVVVATLRISDAYLLARTASMRWAEQIGQPWRED